MTLKEKVYSHCLSIIKERINFFNHTLNELSEGAKNDSKSSAGDKHETARAMMQLEQEKIGAQLKETEIQYSILQKTDINNLFDFVIKGSLVKTSNGYFFIAIALGKINLDSKDVFVLSPQSPLGIKLMGLKTNQSASINGKSYRVEEIS